MADVRSAAADFTRRIANSKCSLFIRPAGAAILMAPAMIPPSLEIGADGDVRFGPGLTMPMTSPFDPERSFGGLYQPMQGNADLMLYRELGTGSWKQRLQHKRRDFRRKRVFAV